MCHLLLLICLAVCLSLRAAEVHTFSGTGAPAYSGDGGPALAAALRNPYGLCIGPDAALYICDMDNHVIRRIKDGEIATVAGTGKRGYSGELEVQAFRLNHETAIVTLPSEIFVEFGLAIKAASPFKTTLVVELANDDLAYIPTKQAFAEGIVGEILGQHRLGDGRELG